MVHKNARPTTEELFEVLKRTSLPTVLVEGPNDIIFYRKMEEDLKDIGVDVLPAGNKTSVLEIQRRVRAHKLKIPCAFVVDKDLWVHTGIPEDEQLKEIITTDGYSIENDLFNDGDLISILDENERKAFFTELKKFCGWYAIAVYKHLNGQSSEFRTHPGKVLDDEEFYKSSIVLNPGEDFPTDFFDEIFLEFGRILRGKSLLAILTRQLSRQGRSVKFSKLQLLVIAASRKGENYKRICASVRIKISMSQEF